MLTPLGLIPNLLNTSNWHLSQTFIKEFAPKDEATRISSKENNSD